MIHSSVAMAYMPLLSFLCFYLSLDSDSSYEVSSVPVHSPEDATDQETPPGELDEG